MSDAEGEATADKSVATDLDVNGAIVAGAFRRIEAPAARVWEVLLAVGQWPEWYGTIKDLKVRDETFSKGSKFSFRTGPATIKAAIDVADEPEVFRFTGKSAGSITTYAFSLTADGEHTEVRAAQSMGGLATRAMKPVLQGVAEKSVVTWLDALADRVTQD